MKQEISGDLANTRCPEIIKILSLGKRTGRLYLTNGSETGNIYFSEGEVVHAQCAALTGIKAIHEIAVWTLASTGSSSTSRPTCRPSSWVSRRSSPKRQTTCGRWTR
jgi:hypothetical protein